MRVRRMRWPRPRGLRPRGRKVRNVCRVKFAAEGVSDVVPAIPPPIAGALGRRSPERQIGFAEPWRYECCGCFVPKKFPFGGRVSGHRRLFRRQRAERRRFVLSGMRAGESPCGAETSHARSSTGAENENAAGKAGCRRGAARLPGGASSSRTAVGQRGEACASLAAQSSWSAQVKQLGSVFVQQTRMPT